MEKGKKKGLKNPEVSMFYEVVMPTLSVYIYILLSD